VACPQAGPRRTPEADQRGLKGGRGTGEAGRSEPGAVGPLTTSPPRGRGRSVLTAYSGSLPAAGAVAPTIATTVPVRSAGRDCPGWAVVP
jgi:hypothetical protein